MVTSMVTVTLEGGVCLGSCLMVHNCSPSSWEVEARSEVQGHPDLHNKLETSLDYLRSQKQACRAFSPSTPEVEAGRALTSGPTLSTK